MHRVVAIIPARFNSTRLPGKPLADLSGKVLIQHVYERVKTAKLIDHTIVATDDMRIFEAVEGFGGEAVMTSISHESGTDRIAEVAEKLECEFVINVQGDEPFIRPEMIDEVVELLDGDERVSIGTLAKKTSDINEIISPNVVKVVKDDEGFALYFSRAPIPFDRDGWNIEKRVDSEIFNLSFPGSDTDRFFCYKHIGIYGYRKEELIRFASTEMSELEKTEKLEQLRALAIGMKIKVKETEHETFGIDTADDLRKAEKWQNISL